MKRAYFLDHLRTVMIFLVIVYHAIYVFSSGLLNTWVVVSETKNENLGLISMYLDTFVMFVFFFISGYLTPYSATIKNSKAFIISKVKRLLIPWLFAMIFIIPAYKYLYLFSRSLPQEPWYTYFHLYSRIGSDLSLFSNNPTQHWLWFLPVLFLFQLLYALLKKSGLLQLNLSINNAVFFTILIGVMYSMVISQFGLTGWTHTYLLDFQNERLFLYFLFFLIGTKCYSLSLFEKPLNKKWYVISNISMSVGITFYTLIALNLFFNMIDPNREYYFISSWADRTLYYFFILVLAFSFLHVLMYPFQKYLNKPIAFFDRLNRNSYYVYIIHMIVMGLVSLFLVKVPAPVFVNYLLVIIATYLVSNFVVSLYYKLFKS